MTVLITGANGFLGRHLVAALQERGERVRALVLPTEDATWLRARDVAVSVGDIRCAESLREPLRGVAGVFHLAGMMGVWRPLADYRAVNVAGTENVCRAALAAGVSRLVHVSSWRVYGTGLMQPAHESCPPRPLYEPYSLTKVEGEQVVRRMILQDGLPAVITRPDTFFGPGDWLHFGRLADRLRAGKGLIIGSGRNAIPLVYVTDVVQGLLLALDHGRAVGQTYNVTNDQTITQEGFLRAIAEEVGAKPPRVHLPYRALFAAALAAEGIAGLGGYRYRPFLTRLSVTLFGDNNQHAIDRARQELGFVPRVSLREGVRLSADWYREQRPSASASPSRVADIPTKHADTA